MVFDVFPQLFSLYLINIIRRFLNIIYWNFFFIFLQSTLYLPNMFVANGGYAVQTFFGISGFITTYFFFKSFYGKKEIKIGYMLLAFFNRYIRYVNLIWKGIELHKIMYFRLTPAVLVMVAIDATWLVHAGRGPFWDKMIGGEYRRCRSNWWTNLLYINNYANKEEMVIFSKVSKENVNYFLYFSVYSKLGT